MKKYPVQIDTGDVKDALSMPYYSGKFETLVDDLLIKVVMTTSCFYLVYVLLHSCYSPDYSAREHLQRA